jgi:hypothetical protein
MDVVIQRIADLERRCAAAERANRHWRAVALAVLTAGAAAVGCGAQQTGPSNSEALECKRLRIREAGYVLAEIGMRPSGGVELAIFDRNQKARISIGVNNKGTPNLQLLDSSEKPRYEAALTSEGDVSHVLRDKDDRSSAWSRVTPNGAVSTGVGAKDNSAAGLNVDASGLPSVVVMDSKQQSRAKLALEESGAVNAVLAHRSGSNGFAFRVADDGSVTQAFSSPDRKTEIVEAITTVGDAISGVTMGEKSEPIFHYKR